MDCELSWIPVFIDFKADSLEGRRVLLPSNVKKVHSVQLMGYSKITTTHNFPNSDKLFAIRIKEVSSNLQSNNQFFNGALHVFQDDFTASYEPLGISCVSFTPVNMPAFTVELVASTGETPYSPTGEIASVESMRLWFKLLVNF